MQHVEIVSGDGTSLPLTWFASPESRAKLLLLPALGIQGTLKAGSDKVHLFKNPVMSGWVDALIETFSDARIVVMMRNPIECIPSCLKLVEVSWKGRVWQREDYAHSLELLIDISVEHFENPRQVLASDPETPQIVVDYRTLSGEPERTDNILMRHRHVQRRYRQY